MPVTDQQVKRKLYELMDDTSIRIIAEAARIALGDVEVFDSLIKDHEFLEVEVRIARERLAEVLRYSIPPR